MLLAIFPSWVSKNSFENFQTNVPGSYYFYRSSYEYDLFVQWRGYNFEQEVGYLPN